jgi:DNA replicative helicase MCM subunit Mcm2 (Cdc46/Mcm family)
MSGPSTGGAFDSIEAFVSTAEGVVATGQDLDEANTKAKILTPLVRTLGWPVHDNTEVLLEYSGEDQFKDRVDYALFDADDLYAVIEAKQIGQLLSEYDSQIRRYMRLYGAEWGLLTNGEDYRIFRSEDNADELLVESLSLADLPTSEYLQHLSRDSVRGGDETPELVNRLSDAKKQEIVELSKEPDLYEQMVRSIAPPVYGYEKEKLALLFALVGGVNKPEGSVRPLSGAIDILLIHDPIAQLTDLIDATRWLAPDSAYFSDSAIKVNSKPQEEKSLIAIAKPEYGRFDQYEPIIEQLGYDGDTLSCFDFVFTLTDQRNRKADQNLARHMIDSNYAGELQVYDNNKSPDKGEKLMEATREFEPPIDRDLLRAYVAYARSNCFPIMSKSAKKIIEDFYVGLRRREEEAPVIANADEIDTLVRTAEASARLRLSDTVSEADAERAVDVVNYALKQIGVNPEPGDFDADIVETGTSKAQRDRTEDIKNLIKELEDEHEEGAPVSEAVSQVSKKFGLEKSKAEKEIENLRRKGEVYEPRADYLRTS